MKTELNYVYNKEQGTLRYLSPYAYFTSLQVSCLFVGCAFNLRFFCLNSFSDLTKNLNLTILMDHIVQMILHRKMTKSKSDYFIFQGDHEEACIETFLQNFFNECYLNVIYTISFDRCPKGALISICPN